MVPIKFIDVSGVGNSGKSAVVDLLREFDCIWSPEYWFEFDFLRVPGGLIDLRHALSCDWSPIRSHAALIEFINVAQQMGVDPSWWNIGGLLRSTSQRYDSRFRSDFVRLSEGFARQFIVGSYLAEWPYDDLAESSLVRTARKLARRLGFRRKLLRDVWLLDSKDFDAHALAYLDNLYRLIVQPECQFVVLNNGFEPFNPRPALDMLQGSRQIVVTRDPRDVYVSGLNAHKVTERDSNLLAFDNDGLSKSFLATDDLKVFVLRYKLYREKVYKERDSRIIHVRFEDLVTKYEEVMPEIMRFLNIPSAFHVRRRESFDPSRSLKNVGVWRKYSKREEIAYIENELREYIWD